MIVKGCENGGVGVGRWLTGFGSLVRRKQVDSVHYRGHAQLARKLSAVDLVGIGNNPSFSSSNYNILFY